MGWHALHLGRCCFSFSAVWLRSSRLDEQAGQVSNVDYPASGASFGLRGGTRGGTAANFDYLV